MHDCARCAAQTLEGSADQIGAGLSEHLYRHVIRNRTLLDQLADEVEVGLRGGRKADLDFLESHPHELLEHAALAGGIHGLDQSLIPVSQVDAAPGRCRGERARGPGAVGDGDRSKRSVLV